MDHRKDHFCEIRNCVLLMNGALLSLLHHPGWDRELLGPTLQWVSSGVRCAMTNEDFPATPDPSPELTGGSEPCPRK